MNSNQRDNIKKKYNERKKFFSKEFGISFKYTLKKVVNKIIILLLSIKCISYLGCTKLDQQESKPQNCFKGILIENYGTSQEKLNDSIFAFTPYYRDSIWKCFKVIKNNKDTSVYYIPLKLNDYWKYRFVKIKIKNSIYTIERYIYNDLAIFDGNESYFILKEKDRLIHLKSESWGNTASFITSKLENDILDSLMLDTSFFGIAYKR